MSQKLGLSTEAYQKWDYVIGQAGGDIDSMSAGFKTMTGALADAQNGTQSAIDKFTALGLSIEDIKSLDSEQMFEKGHRKSAEHGRSDTESSCSE